MAPILYYSLCSPPVRGVLLVAKNIGLELELKELNLMAGEHLSEEFVSINPQHTIPTLVDDDGEFILWDSHAIATYLVEKYADDDSLYPNDVQRRARISQRLHFDSSLLFPIGSGIIKSIVFKGCSEVPAELIEEAEKAFDYLNTFLNEDDYLAGGSLTVADLCLIPIIATINEFVPIEEDRYPNLYAYLKRIPDEIEGFQEINVEGMNHMVGFVKSKMAENELNES